jgi:hypothetical protein
VTEARDAPLPPGRLGRVRASLDRPAALLVAITLVWGVWALAVVHRDEVDWMPRVGITFLDQGAGASAAIDALRPDAAGQVGYDGQFFYFLALDPRNAEPYVDAPAYRFGRIGYPTVVRVVAAGQPEAVPWALLLVNLVAVAAGTFLLARLLSARGVSPWFAILYGTAPGLFIAVSRDLSEPLAYALAIAGLAAMGGGRRRLGLAAVLFGLAGLTREITLLFPVALAVALALGWSDGGPRRARDLRSAGWLLGLSLAPYLLLRAALLVLVEGGNNPEAGRFPIVPFGGLLEQAPFNRLALEQLYSVVAPSLLALFFVAAWTRRLGPTLAMLALNVAVLVVFLPAPSYVDFQASGRIGLGVIVAFVAAVPLLPAQDRVLLFAVPAALWLAPWFNLFPTAFGR